MKKLDKHKILHIAKHQKIFYVNRYKWSKENLNKTCKNMAKKEYLKFEGIYDKMFSYSITEKGLEALKNKVFLK